ncbi:hypothetical protein GWK48_10440 [Metallosphaera tengchongensis]|uniref:Uncharacterized protein n=1 Tax=Metallosphaera tengchongensis TaxID=1532350 RepID=A0A6N0P080_9CREN|nr:hypothetical protein [Metallosphaera tengchongensis]QKR00751.1 hypothetical protein GWK48_10440 [Metallosphaera tengchongensis]
MKTGTVLLTLLLLSLVTSFVGHSQTPLELLNTFTLPGSPSRYFLDGDGVLLCTVQGSGLTSFATSKFGLYYVNASGNYSVLNASLLSGAYPVIFDNSSVYVSVLTFAPILLPNTSAFEDSSDVLVVSGGSVVRNQTFSSPTVAYPTGDQVVYIRYDVVLTSPFQSLGSNASLGSSVSKYVVVTDRGDFTVYNLIQLQEVGEDFLVLNGSAGGLRLPQVPGALNLRGYSPQNLTAFLLSGDLTSVLWERHFQGYLSGVAFGDYLAVSNGSSTLVLDSLSGKTLMEVPLGGVVGVVDATGGGALLYLQSPDLSMVRLLFLNLTDHSYRYLTSLRGQVVSSGEAGGVAFVSVEGVGSGPRVSLVLMNGSGHALGVYNFTGSNVTALYTGEYVYAVGFGSSSTVVQVFQVGNATHPSAPGTGSESGGTSSAQNVLGPVIALAVVVGVSSLAFYFVVKRRHR